MPKMEQSNTYLPCTGIIVRRSFKAVLFKFDDYKNNEGIDQCWIPNSQIINIDSIGSQDSGECELKIAQWLLEKNGLV